MLAYLQTSPPGRWIYTAWFNLLASPLHWKLQSCYLQQRSWVFSVQGLRSNLLSQWPQVAVLGVTGSLPLPCSQSEDKTHHSIQAPNTKLPSELDPLHYPRRSHGAQGVTCQSKMSPKCVLGPISSQSSFCCHDGVLRSTWGWHSLLSGWPQFLTTQSHWSQIVCFKKILPP